MPRPKKETTDTKKQSKLTDAAKSLATKTEKGAKEVAKKVTKTTKKAAPAVKSAESAAKANVMLQYAGKDISYDELVQNAKNKYQYDMGGDVDAIKEIDLYVKPDESKVYFVIDGNIEGDYDL
jgi:predicted RecB family nuclease